MNRYDPLFVNAGKIKPLKGYTDIVCHGSPSELLIYGMNEEEWSYSAAQAADMVRNSGGYDGGDIRLIACNTGSGPRCIAQQLADALNVNVLAPTEAVFVSIDGELFVTDNGVLARMWNCGEAVKETGKWVLFRPKKG